MVRVILAPININSNQILYDIIPKLERNTDLEFNIRPLNLDISNAFSIERGQYYSTKILSLMLENLDNDYTKVVGIVKIDLYIPVLTYVFVEAQLNGRCSIVSLVRLHEEFYSGRSEYNLIKLRTLKEILHELGHNFGMIHCKDWECVMHSSSSIEEIDIKDSKYCKNCKQKIDQRNMNS